MASNRPPYATDLFARRTSHEVSSAPAAASPLGRRVRLLRAWLPLALMAAGGSLLSGCVSVPDLGARPSPAAPTQFASRQSLAGTGATWPEERWWTAFNDPQLDTLIDEALAGSPDLAAADARMRRAAGAAQAAGAALAPQLSATGEAAMMRQSLNNGIPPQFVPQGWNDTGRVALNLSYELDFFGRNRASLRAATSQADAARIEAQAARISLAAAVADSYAAFARIRAEKTVAEETLRVRRETANLVQQRVQNGLDTLADLRQAEALLGAARSDLGGVAQAEAQTRNRIAFLLGAGPDRGLTLTPPERIPARVAQGATGLPDNIALNLIGRRADIVAARIRAEAAGQRIQVARADFYPNINLTAFIGLQSLGLGNLIDGGSRVGSVGPAISLPIFDGGGIQGRYRQARADYDEAVALYDSTLVRALQEVADAAATRRALDERITASRAALVAAEEAWRLAGLRYRGGLATYLTVLSAEDGLINARRRLAGLEADAFTTDVALIRALGGGFAS